MDMRNITKSVMTLILMITRLINSRYFSIFKNMKK